MILLDTDICVEILRGNRTVIEKRRRNKDKVAVSFISVGELYFGAFRSTFPEKNQRQVEIFLLSIPILESDPDIMLEFGRLKAHHVTRGDSIPDADFFIAATALKRCTRLVTGNQRHFQRFSSLSLENWIK